MMNAVTFCWERRDLDNSVSLREAARRLGWGSSRYHRLLKLVRAYEVVEGKRISLREGRRRRTTLRDLFHAFPDLAQSDRYEFARLVRFYEEALAAYSGPVSHPMQVHDDGHRGDGWAS